MKHQRKKKKGPKAPKECRVSNSVAPPSGCEIVLRRLLEPFASVSPEEAASAYKEVNGDLNRAAEILGNLVESVEDQSTTSSISSWNASSSSCTSSSELSSEDHCVQYGVQQKSKAKKVVGNLVERSEYQGMTSSISSWYASSSSCTSLSELSGEDHCARYGGRQKSKVKKLVASAGTVSAILGKDYVSSLPKKNSLGHKRFNCERYSKEDAEQFLCSMLGEKCQLSLAVVRDVLCQCGYNFDKALNILLELSASSVEQSDMTNTLEETFLLSESNDNLTNTIFDSSSYSFGSDFQEKMLYGGNPWRNRFKFVLDNTDHSSPPQGNSESQLPKEVLKSLFNVPTPKTVEHEPGAVKWRDVVTKMTSLGLNSEPSPANCVPDLPNYAKGDDYQAFREVSTRHWESMKSYYRKAASAFTNGERQYAAYLADQGRTQNRKALEAEEKASQNIFEARNKSIENVITIDLHGQHVKQAMRLLKLHLLFGAFGRSVRLFRVITGCGGQGIGKSKLKLAVINLLEKEEIEWSEENKGTLLIKLRGQTNFSFLDSDSDTE